MELYIATYVLLILSMCILLVSGDKWAKNTAGAGGGLAVVSGTMSGIVGIYGIAALIILTAVAIIYYKIERFKLILFILLIVIVVPFFLHKVGGIHNYLVVKDLKTSTTAIPYSLYLNFDKGFAGLVLLFMFINKIKEKLNFNIVIKVISTGILTVAVCLGIAYMSGFTAYEYKISKYLLWFIAANLFFTCLPEEVLFRGIIQNNLIKLLGSRKYGIVISLIISSGIFAMIHFPGGIVYVIMAFAAGMGYGAVYIISKRIELAIAVHFMLNITHFILFIYPAIQR